LVTPPQAAICQSAGLPVCRSASLGTWVGARLPNGLELGFPLGRSDGLELGFMFGAPDGLELGLRPGPPDGLELGLVLGYPMD
jgi:hypothetical protein